MTATTTILSPATLRLPDPMKKLRDLAAELNRLADILHVRQKNAEGLARNWPPPPPNKAWSSERRAAQSQRIRAAAPWKKSTGPQTAAGKARASRNACKRADKIPDISLRGLHRQAIRRNNDRMRALRRVLRQFQRFYRCELKALAKLIKRGIAPATTLSNSSFSAARPPPFNSSLSLATPPNCATME